MEDQKLNQSCQCSPKAWLFVLIVVIISACVGVFVYFWQQHKFNEMERNLNYRIDFLESQVADSKKVDAEDMMVEKENSDDLNFVSLDETWNLYTNEKYGFSIKVPKMMYQPYGDCVLSNGFFVPKGDLVPVKIFEDESIFISSEYYHDLQGQFEIEGKTVFSGCEKVANSIPLLQDRNNYKAMKWEFVASEVESDVELEKFIKEKYGSGCSLGKKVPTEQSGVYRPEILGDGLDLGETACPINYITEIRYNADTNKVVAWDLGQAYTFVGDEDFSKLYDQEMVDSFKFE